METPAAPSRGTWARRQLRALEAIGDVLVPGDEDLPSFSRLGCVAHVDRLLDFMPDDDLRGLQGVLSAASFLPRFLVAGLLRWLEAGLWPPGPWAPPLRVVRMGLRGIVLLALLLGRRRALLRRARAAGRPGATSHTRRMKRNALGVVVSAVPPGYARGNPWEAHIMRRRSFLAAAAAIAGSTTPTPTPAAEGGKPVRDTPLRSTYSGPEYYDDKELAELRDVLEKRPPFRWYGPGSQPPMKVLTFEKELAARMQTKYALAVTSGTAALTTALAALGVGPGDEVILPAWSWYSCFNSIVMNGALPVFAESDESFNVDPADLESKITPQTKVIMVVHTMGNPADMDAIMAVARRRGDQGARGLRQSVGGSYKGKPVGSIGDIGIYSFQIAKTISSGEGGGLVTSDPLLFERASRYHDLGLLRPPHQAMLGGAALQGMIGNQYRMSEFTGGVLLAQLRKLDTIVGGLRGHARQRVRRDRRPARACSLRQRPDPGGRYSARTSGSASRRRTIATGSSRRMAAENVPAGTPLAVALVPLQPAVEQKLTAHPNWPSFTSERGRSIRYGAGVLPQDDRHPPPIRGHHTRPEVHPPRRRRHRRGHPQGLSRAARRRT